MFKTSQRIKISASLLICSHLFYSGPSSAKCYYPVTFSLSPYVGIEFVSRHLGFQSGFGDNLFEKNYPQANFYAGIMLSEFLGIELGYETTTRKTRHSTLNSGSIILGTTIPEGINNAEFKSNGKFMGPYFNIVGVLRIHPNYPLDLFATIGASYLTAEFDRLLQSSNGIPLNIQRTFESEKTIARMTTGIQYEIMDGLSIRGSVGFENTSRFTLHPNQPLAVYPTPTIKLKNSMMYGIGAFYSF